MTNAVNSVKTEIHHVDKQIQIIIYNNVFYNNNFSCGKRIDYKTTQSAPRKVIYFVRLVNLYS